MGSPESFGPRDDDIQPDNSSDVGDMDLMLPTEDAETNDNSAEETSEQAAEAQESKESKPKLSLAVFKNREKTANKLEDYHKKEQEIEERADMTEEQKEEAKDKLAETEIEETQDEIRESVSSIAPVTTETEEDGAEKKTSKLDEYEEGRGIDGFYEDYLIAQNIENKEERERAENEVKRQLGEAVGEENQNEAFEILTNDENMERQYYVLFQEKMRMLRKMDPRLSDKFDMIMKKDMPPIEKLNEIDKLFDEAANEYESIKELHGLSKTIDRKVGIPSLIEAYEEAKADGLSMAEFEAKLEELGEATNQKFNPMEDPEASEGVRILKNDKSFNEVLSGEYVEYMGDGNYQGDMKGTMLYYNVDFDTREVKEKYVKIGDKKIDIRKTEPESLGVNEALSKLGIYRAGASDLAENENIVRKIAQEAGDMFMDADFVEKIENKFKILRGVDSSEEARYESLKVFEDNSKVPSIVFDFVMDWMDARAGGSRASDMQALGSYLEKDNDLLVDLVRMCTENDDESPKSAPTFDTSITVEDILDFRKRRIDQTKE